MSNQYVEFVDMLTNERVHTVYESLDSAIEDIESAWPVAAVNGIPPWSVLSGLWYGMQELRGALIERMIEDTEAGETFPVETLFDDSGAE